MTLPLASTTRRCTWPWGPFGPILAVKSDWAKLPGIDTYFTPPVALPDTPAAAAPAVASTMTTAAIIAIARFMLDSLPRDRATPRCARPARAWRLGHSDRMRARGRQSRAVFGGMMVALRRRNYDRRRRAAHVRGVRRDLRDRRVGARRGGGERRRVRAVGRHGDRDGAHAPEGAVGALLGDDDRHARLRRRHRARELHRRAGRDLGRARAQRHADGDERLDR